MLPAHRASHTYNLMIALLKAEIPSSNYVFELVRLQKLRWPGRDIDFFFHPPLSFYPRLFFFIRDFFSFFFIRDFFSSATLFFSSTIFFYTRLFFYPRLFLFAACVETYSHVLWSRPEIESRQYGSSNGGRRYRGYYTVARRYEFYVRVARTISQSQPDSMT